MVRLRVTEILEERGKTEDWLFRQTGMTDYRSFRKLIHNESSRIRFEAIAKICAALDVPAGELFRRPARVKSDHRCPAGHRFQRNCGVVFRER